MSDAATPVAPAPAPTPAPAAPATPANAAPAAPAEETVTLPKKEADQLRRDAARARSAQRAASRLGSGGHFTPESQAPRPAPTREELEERAHEEDLKAERGLMGLAVAPEYREVLDADPTLRDMLVKNPLSVLPVLAKDALDAEDAVELVKEELGKRLEAIKAKKAPAPAAPAAPAAEPAKPTPPAGGVNVAGDQPNAEYEAAKKDPRTEHAVAGMIGSRIKAAAGKK